MPAWAFQRRNHQIINVLNQRCGRRWLTLQFFIALGWLDVATFWVCGFFDERSVLFWHRDFYIFFLLSKMASAHFAGQPFFWHKTLWLPNMNNWHVFEFQTALKIGSQSLSSQLRLTRKAQLHTEGTCKSWLKTTSWRMRCLPGCWTRLSRPFWRPSSFPNAGANEIEVNQLS